MTTGSEIRDLVWKNLEEQINNGSYEYAPEHRYKVNCTQLPVLRIRIRDELKFFDADPGSRLKKFGSGIRNEKKLDPGSGINISDPQHCQLPVFQIQIGSGFN